MLDHVGISERIAWTTSEPSICSGNDKLAACMIGMLLAKPCFVHRTCSPPLDLRVHTPLPNSSDSINVQVSKHVNVNWQTVVSYHETRSSGVLRMELANSLISFLFLVMVLSPGSRKSAFANIFWQPGMWTCVLKCIYISYGMTDASKYLLWWLVWCSL